MLSLILLMSYVTGGLLLFISYLIYKQFAYWRRHKILHLKPVPVIGNNYPIVFRITAFPVHSANLYKEFPGASYFGSFDFLKPVLVVKDPELIRDICVKSYENFIDHEAFVTEEMDPIAGRNLFSLKGQRWKDVRSTLSPSYTASRMKLLFGLISECSNEFVQYFLDHPEVAKSFESKEYFTRYANDVIATSAFGVKVNSMKNENNEFFKHGIVATPFGSNLWITKVLMMRSCTRLMRMLGATFLPKSADRFFKKLVTDTVRLRKDKSIVRPDMIQLLIQAMDKSDGVNVTMDDIMGQSFIFFLAGFDTASSYMSFLAHELAARQDIQDKLYREIEDQFDKINELTYDTLSNMKYLDMVLNETLRMYPPASIINRVCVNNHKFPPSMKGQPEYVMEKDTIIMIPIFGLHRDPRYFPEPDKFIPERFNEDNKGKIKPYTYMPFGSGPRKCIGERFVLMETKIVIVQLLRKFVIKFSERSQYPVEFSKTGFNIGAEGGLWLRLEERKKFD